MNRQTLLLFLIMMVGMMVIMRVMAPDPSATGERPDPAAMFEIADKQFETGDYKASFKTYEQIASEHKNTENGARALLLKAQAYNSATGKAKNERAAIDTYKRLVRGYDPSEYPPAAQGERELLALRTQLDREASGHWLYRTLDGFVSFGRSLGAGAYSYALALLLITIIVKVITWPLSTIQYKGMRDMQRIQPVLKEIQEKYKGNSKELNTKMMEAYKREGVNPLMGCLPLLVQFPILILVYHAIMKYEFQFQNGVFLWINSAMHARFDFIGANLAQPDIPLVILYTLSMFITQKLTVVDPTQAQQQKLMMIMMPLMFAFLFWKFASAFLLYWLSLNIVMTIHQYIVMKSGRPTPAPQPVAVEPPKPSGDAPRSRRRRRR